MPELPEVETTLRGIEPHLQNNSIVEVVVRNRRLRWPIPANLKKSLTGHRVISLSRRAKYLFIHFAHGTLILHLGMSGSLRIVDQSFAVGKHDHLDLVLSSAKILRFNDPRRFGAVLWTKNDPHEHELISHLGPEPLSDEFSDDYLFEKSRKRQVAVKQFIMDNKVVVGVGNIYANEALFLSGIRPTVKASALSKKCYALLLKNIKQVLQHAIIKGGTTLKDFTNSDGKPGYFQQQLRVYGRTNEPCTLCQTPIKQIVQGQRSSFYCPSCQGKGCHPPL